MSEKETKNEVDIIKDFFIKNYSPASATESNLFFMTTEEIFNSFLKIFPGSGLQISDITCWLTERQFLFIEMGCFKFEWVLKRN